MTISTLSSLGLLIMAHGFLLYRRRDSGSVVRLLVVAAFSVWAANRLDLRLDFVLHLDGAAAFLTCLGLFAAMEASESIYGVVSIALVLWLEIVGSSFSPGNFTFLVYGTTAICTLLALVNATGKRMEDGDIEARRSRSPQPK